MKKIQLEASKNPVVGVWQILVRGANPIIALAFAAGVIGIFELARAI